MFSHVWNYKLQKDGLLGTQSHVKQDGEKQLWCHPNVAAQYLWWDWLASHIPNSIYAHASSTDTIM